MEILNLKGMTCGGCTSAVTKALKATQGVEDVAVDPGKAQATHDSAPSKSGGCCGSG